MATTRWVGLVQILPEQNAVCISLELITGITISNHGHISSPI